MIETESDERILDQFRTWLEETRREAAAIEDSTIATTPAIGFGLDRLVEEFTALRQEIKLQTRSSRSLEEKVEAALAPLAEATTTLRTAAAQALALASATDEKNFAMTLADLDESLERGSVQWKKNVSRLTSPSAVSPIDLLNRLYSEQSWWQRRRTAGYHQRACAEIAKAIEQAESERLAILTALLNGYGLIQQRLARTMAQVGVTRMPTVGRIVDPETMIVVEVVDSPGPAGQVIEEIRRGYTWKNGLLRTAEVRAIRPRFDGEKQTISEGGDRHADNAEEFNQESS